MMTFKRLGNVPERRERSLWGDSVRGKADIDEDGNGWIEGYLAVFNNIDRQRERILPGAFARTVAERVAAKRVPLMSRHIAHGGDVRDMCGIITEAKEDDYGLWIHADFDASDLAQQEIRPRCVSGHAWGLSVGYELVKWTEAQVDGKYVIDLLECKLLEGTVTISPANELAVISAAKSLRSEFTSLPTIGQDRERVDSFQGKVDRLVQLVEHGTIEEEVPQGALSVPSSEDTDTVAILRAKSRLSVNRVELLQLEM